MPVSFWHLPFFQDVIGNQIEEGTDLQKAKSKKFSSLQIESTVISELRCTLELYMHEAQLDIQHRESPT